MPRQAMEKAPWEGGLPRLILLATDLSCRCDRALDRAVLLAQQWRAKLLVVHVLEGTEPRDPPPLDLARRQVEADLEGRSVEWELALERGEPAEAILRQAQAQGAGLIVTGVARRDPLGESTLGAIVEQLAKQAPIPLLAVKGRARRPYARLVVATDFSEPSRHAIACARALLPDTEMALFHAYRLPFEGFIGKDGNESELRAMAEGEAAAFLKAEPSSPPLRMEYGWPESALSAHVRKEAIELAMLGTQGRTGLKGFLVGSVAKRLMACLPCDVLVVRGPEAG
ncbi:universal stress protein [Sabulicella glaciei]|uniref:Universal stress protein n=1 Tax=Sabulicella glaciei TaxID=2984948 RepID=A0ABT3NRX1_9PROT|nr:universal stress protein [Roseococcus sp. MDT2-1-1]MCW8084913.1 universal stress protein [Roseococcus sp. MDT2-1-1]